MRTAIFSLLICCSSTIAAGQDDAVERAANFVSHEAAICFAYYNTVNRCISLDGSQGDLAEGYKRTAENSFLIMTKTGKLVGLNTKAHEARIKMAISDMMDAIDDDCINISVLLADYADSCQALLEQPEKRFQHWLDKAQQ